jgi:ABC-type multidrug transport system fused ATPase/permease subunit
MTVAPAPAPAPAADPRPPAAAAPGTPSAGPGDKAGVPPPKVPVNRETLRQAARLFAYLLPYRGKFIAAMVALLLSTTLGLGFPYLIGSLIDVALRNGHLLAAPAPAGGALGMMPLGGLAGHSFPRLTLNQVFILLICQLTLQALFTYFQVTWFNQVGERALVNIRCDTYARLISLPMAFFSQRRVGELASRISADLTQIEDTLTGATPQFLRQTTLLLGGMIFIVLTSGRLTLVMLSCFPPIILVAIIFGKKMRGVSRQAQDRLAESNTVVDETLQGIASVKAFVNERYEISRYSASIEAFLHAILRGVRYRAAFVAFIIFALFGAIVIVMWYGCRLLQAGQLSIGDLTRFTIYTSFVAGAMGSFADLYGQIQKTVGATARVRELLLEEPEPVLALPPTPLLADEEKRTVPAASANGAQPSADNAARLAGDVVFEQVDFSYPSRPEVTVLKKLSLHARPGERVALVGPSGAGKSTLVSLLLRFYEPSHGVIRFDGKPAAEYPLVGLRAQMGIVPQEVLLFGGSITENIAYGRPGASPEEVIAAARQANAHDFITRFPEGYETMVGERGVKLSGGQRQRIAIARAILKNPAILLLDEATSSLDSESERLVQDALDLLMRGRTSFIVAHRLATVRAADQIIVIEEGAVVETGTHAELLANKDGLYRRLSEFQFDLAPT